LILCGLAVFMLIATALRLAAHELSHYGDAEWIRVGKVISTRKRSSKSVPPLVP
jgi:hypothetical protein